MILGLGLDLSLNATGVALLGRDKGSHKIVSLMTNRWTPPFDDRYDKVDWIAEQLNDLLDSNGPLSSVCLEGYGQGLHRNVQSFIKLVEVGTMVRMILRSYGHSWLEVPPASLKKFVTGRGTKVSKKEMIHGVREKWKFDTNDDNVADAYGCARFGLAYHGHAICTGDEAEVVQRVKSR